MRVQFSGAVPLAQYEIFAESLRSVREQAASLKAAMLAAEMAKNVAEDKAAALALQNDGLQVCIDRPRKLTRRN